ncbi:MAG: restriction endonuclease subunit S [Lachnospiraceae bacterium]|nr:restriction endonuclease subunit S [Lachnospiraceae bacterium]
MKGKSNTPSIRFKGFSDDWEQRKAKELFVSTADKGYPELPVLSATQDRGMIRRDENNINIFHDKKNEAGYKRVLPGQFVIHLRSFQGGFAHSAIEGITSPAYTVFDFSEPEKHDSEYWKYVFTSKSFIRRLEIVTYGIRDGRSISYEEFLTLGFVYPSKAEQTAIARYLDKLSDLITLHQRKLEKLQNIKKSMLEKMFPQNGSNVPEIRFKGFTDAWEQHKLGEVSDSYSGGTPTVGVKEYYGGQIPFIRSAEINSDCTELFITDDGLKNSSARLVSKGDILYALYGATSGEVGRARLNGAINQAILAIKPYSGYDYEFISQWLRKSKQSIIETYLQGGQGNLSGTIVKDLVVQFPTLPEQEVIGTYFANLDNLITLHQRKLEKLQNIKKSMLEKMFV